MSGTLAQGIQALFPDDAPLDRLTLHAGLFRLCQTHFTALATCRGKSVWRTRQIEHQHTLDALEDDDAAAWHSAIRNLLLRWPTDEKRQIVACAAALRSLDDLHRRRRVAIGPEPVSLPSWFGGRAATLFLPPPRSPWLEWRPEEKKLPREGKHVDNDVRGLLRLYWYLVARDHHAVTPRIAKLKPAVARVLERRIARGKLHVALSAPLSERTFGIEGDLDQCGPDGTPYLFLPLIAAERKAARDEIDALLNACAQQEVDVLCLPELTVDPHVLGHLSDVLATSNDRDHPALVVAGSYHRSHETGWRNRCTVLDARGRVVFEQDKASRFCVPAAEAARMTPTQRALLGIDERGGCEGIDLTAQLWLIESPIGRFTTPICLDYCGDALTSLYKESGTNLFLVPAMTTSMTLFHTRAHDLAKTNRAATFVINSGWVLRQLGAGKTLTKRMRERLLLAHLPVHGCTYSEAGECDDGLYVFTVRELLLAS